MQVFMKNLSRQNDQDLFSSHTTLLSTPWTGCPVHRTHSGAGRRKQSRCLFCRGKREGTKWFCEAKECPLVLRDPAGSNMATNCCSSSPWHPQPRYQLQCVLGLTLALGRRTCTECHWTSAPFGLCVCLGGVRVRQRNSISISSKHGCFQLQRLLIQLVASTQAAAVTYLSLQWVRKGLYEKSRAAIFLDWKGLENKALCIW